MSKPSMAKLFEAAPDLYTVAELAEAFVADELETRRQSFLPSTDEGELTCIGEAEQTLAEIRRALALARGEK